MTRRLARHVHVRNESGVFHVFGPDDDVPSWAEDKISNPAAWADGASLPSAPSAPARPDPAPRRTEVQTTPEAQAAEQSGPPPQAGRGSSTSAWRAYAERHGVQVAPDADHADIITAVRDKGVPVG